MEPEVASRIRAELGEGPSWDAENGILYWVDIKLGLIYSHRPGIADDDIVATAKSVSCVVPRREGGLALTLQHGYYGLDLATKNLESISEEVEMDLDGNRFNDGKCDPAGRFWAGTMDESEKNPSGSLYCLENNRKPKKVFSNVTISNGLGWSPDCTKMYYIDSLTRKISSFDYSLRTGEISNRQTAVDFDKTNQKGVPDGMAVDANGMIWVAHWGGARLTRWNPSTGILLETLHVPAEQVSSCCFAGEHLEELYITSARTGLDAKELASKPLTGSLFVVRPGVRGLPTNSFHG